MFTKSITSHSQRTTLCHATRYLAALMLLSFSQLSNAGRPEEGETPRYAGLQDRLESGKYAVVMVVDAYGEIKLLDPQGNELRPCGRTSVHGRIDEECNLKDLDLFSVQTIQLFIIKKEQSQKISCIVEQIGDYLYVQHSGGDKYPAGAQPCHVGRH